ncbi:molybdopterin-guanine dinucleotide biosynthesis protein B [Phreatobacter stygius]|uniref:Molybdopterin-guanine dinucleotide biosynthesis protein B n=1 Tax=Phreatobacter stygius TaxID=1940610 RepID=A0A4D7BAW8_9HYPH|nr:molybdopterin-guanine dinucleotide biosynthesis protein B [Phreatobacter stygius]QCI67915.1 molybdopterin-guanine dinucleotide biosynthesis protein B [Phreatobacter stygius]
MKVIGLAGWSGAGKTTLLVKVLQLLTARGLKVATLKHAHHAFDIDQPGKDSHAHRAAGASEVLVASAHRYALIHELRGEDELTLAELLRKLSPCDLVIVEGFKSYGHPKVEVHRAANDKPWLFGELANISGIVADGPAPDFTGPVADLDDVAAAAELLLAAAEPIAAVLATLDGAGRPHLPRRRDP